MNLKAILGISLAAIFVVSMVSVNFASVTADHLPNVVKQKIKDQDGALHVQLKTDTKIPKNAESGLFGYAVLTSGTENVLAFTTHKCAADSPLQGNASDEDCPNPVGLLEALGTGLSNADHDDATWHPHILDLTPIGEESEGYCADEGADFEVNLTTSPANNVSPADYEFAVGAKNINVVATKGPADVLGDAEDAVVVRFTIGADADADGNITDLCVFLH